jgi:peptidoglycan-N-acetylglucosamine deacetylase
MNLLNRLIHRTPCWRPPFYRGIWNLPTAVAKPNQPPTILLTFDDGPSENGLAISALLREHSASAIFFVRADRLPGTGSQPTPAEEKAVTQLRALVTAGHMIGCHGLKHHRLSSRLPGSVRRELREAALRIESATGVHPPCFRPPFGSWAPWLNHVPQNLGMPVMFWTSNPFDYNAPTPEALLKRLLPTIRHGDILLLHCTGPGEAITLEALPAILTNLRERGFRFLEPGGLLESGVL